MCFIFVMTKIHIFVMFCRSYPLQITMYQISSEYKVQSTRGDNTRVIPTLHKVESPFDAMTGHHLIKMVYKLALSIYRERRESQHTVKSKRY